MDLFLIRHAEAIGYADESIDSDDKRYLTAKGRAMAASAAITLKSQLSNLDKIFASPLVRAVQTAEIFAAGLNYHGEIEIVNELSVDTSISKIQKLLARNKKLNSAALVGHEPTMSMLVKSLTNTDLKEGFKRSGVCSIDYDTGANNGRFKWFYNPKTNSFLK
jgi:phosphohistidine phosphatase